MVPGASSSIPSRTRIKLLVAPRSPIAAPPSCMGPSPPPPVDGPPPCTDRCSSSTGLCSSSTRRSLLHLCAPVVAPPPHANQARPCHCVDFILIVGLARPPILPTSIHLFPSPLTHTHQRPTRMQERRESTSTSAFLLPVMAFAHRAHAGCTTVTQ
jgi:hypothetical protein